MVKITNHNELAALKALSTDVLRPYVPMFKDVTEDKDGNGILLPTTHSHTGVRPLSFTHKYSCFHDHL